jgi:hypothetical protein
MSRRIDLAATASEATRRRNPAIFGERPSNFAPERKKLIGAGFTRIEPKSSNFAKSDGETVVSGGATKQKAMNKTETMAAQWLRLNGFACLIAQPTRLFPLAGGGTYTPDFLAWERSGAGGVWVIEVKGGYRGPGAEQGYDRYKRAALQYSPPGSPWRFALLTWHARRREWTWEAWI